MYKHDSNVLTPEHAYLPSQVVSQTRRFWPLRCSIHCFRSSFRCLNLLVYARFDCPRSQGGLLTTPAKHGLYQQCEKAIEPGNWNTHHVHAHVTRFAVVLFETVRASFTCVSFARTSSQMFHFHRKGSDYLNNALVAPQLENRTGVRRVDRLGWTLRDGISKL